MSMWLVLKNLKNNHQAKKSFIVRLEVKKIFTKNKIMFSWFGTNLK